MNKQEKADRIRRYMSEDGLTTSQVIKRHPNLAGGLDLLVEQVPRTQPARGSGPSRKEEPIRGTADLGLPEF